MKLKTCLAIAAILFAALNLHAQKNKIQAYEFKKITPADFQASYAGTDTSYGAIVLADVGKSSFIANKKGFFSLLYTHQRRIRVLDPKGFDIATVNIPLYRDVKNDSEESLEALKAITYNLENGVVVETKLNKDEVYKEVQDRNHQRKKFTFPAVKAGSILEYSYTIESDFLFNLQPWSFQGSYPRLWSEYVLDLPQFFDYVFLSKGYLPFEVKATAEKFQNFSVRVSNGAAASDDIISLSSNNTVNKWAMKNVPALREESFTTSIDNHIACIEFQMRGQKFPNMDYRDIMGSWVKASSSLMKRDDFGAEFSNANNWLNETMKRIALDGKGPLEKAKAIYNYVQQNFSSNGMRGIYTTQSLKETLRSKKGYSSEINLLLTLMLRDAGLNSDPVILSTRKNGKVIETYPLMHQYNYVLSKVEVDGKIYYLDGSYKHLGFGKVPNYCYNGLGVSLSEIPKVESLMPDQLVESSVTNVALMNDEKNAGKWSGRVMSYMGYVESTDLRDEIDSKGKVSYESKVKDNYTGEFKVSEVKLENLDDNEKVVLLSHPLEIERDTTNNLIYFNPMLKDGIKENYFKSTQRLYPVELPYKMDQTYVFFIDVPEGYVVDEIPKSTRVLLNDNEGSFEYIITKTDTQISLRSKLSINKTFFPPDEYENLRGFFDFIVKKHAEQIVFKKK